MLLQPKTRPLFADYYANIAVQKSSHFSTLWPPIFYKIRDIPEFEANFPLASKFFILRRSEKLTLLGKMPFLWQNEKYSFIPNKESLTSKKYKKKNV